VKDTTAAYQRLQALIIEEGCPVCHLSQEAATTYLDTILWESSTDLNVHELLTASLGFCGRHSRELLTFGGQRPAAAVVERSSLLAAIRRLPELVADAGSPPPSQFRLWGVRHQPRARKGEQPPLPDSIKPCPACVRQLDEETRGIKILLAHLEEFTSPLLAAGGLCLPHFLQAVSIANHTEREVLLSIQQSVWATLAENLDEFIRKQMHQHHGEPISEPARQAVERTIDSLTGLYPVR